MEKVVVGLSGGVDSAVCSAMLKNQGYEVHGLFLDFGLSSPDDAKKVANDLGIQFHIRELKHELESKVCTYFIEEYKNGRTPNPCIVCNPTVKFQSLIDFADEIGANYIATGHYAETDVDGEGRVVLKMADSPKDQSYMLCRLSRDVISRVIFPLGKFKTKDEVRKQAEELNISIASKPDSMEICFVPDGDYTKFMEKNGVTLPEGNFVDQEGNILGRHKGIHHYTVGQRKGLGVSASGKLFVHKIDVERNEVVLSLNDVYKKQIRIQNVNYICDEYKDKEFDADIKVRYSRNMYKGKVIPDGADATIIFEDEVRAPTKGQSAVFYIGDILIGGGFIQ